MNKNRMNMEKTKVEACNTKTGAMAKLIQQIQQTSFGEIVVTIHDSRIVQIEKREKTRFQD
jgi:hypothetical protein